MVPKHTRIAHMVVLALLLGVAGTLLAMPSAALAAIDGIGGCDHVFAGQESPAGDPIDILTIAGDDGETVYLEITQADGRTVASHLCYVLHDEDGATDEDGKVVGVVSVGVASGVSLDGATVKVFEDRAQSRPFPTGTISAVYAKLGTDGQARVPLAMRTMVDGEDRPFSAPATLAHDGAVYALVSDSPTIEDGHATYLYEVSADTPASVDGHISYYDSKVPGDPIKVDTVADIRMDTSREVAIPDVIVADGNAYRTIQLTDKVTLSHPGTTEYSVQCLRLESSAWATQSTPYKARIHYVDASGRSLGVTDSVIVDRKYLYTPPARLHVRGDGGHLATYALSDGNDLSDGGAIVLEPGQSDGTVDIDVTYEPLADGAERSWTVVLVNGSVSPDDPTREIRRVTYRGTPGQVATHPTDASIEVDGTTLVPSSFAEASYEHTFGTADDQVDQVIYYVPDGWTAPEAYEIKVNYVNIATNGVISSETYTASPTMRRDLEISTPATFEKGGTEYIRLGGQDRSIRHSFYAPNRAYNVYYRTTDDDLHTKTVIRTVRVEYIDPETGDTVRRPTTGSPQAPQAGASDGDAGTTIGLGAGAPTRQADGSSGTSAGTTAGNETPNGTSTQGTPTGNGTAANGGTPATTTPATTLPARDGTETGIGTDEDVVSIIDDETPLGLVTTEGPDLATVRIEDNETPKTANPGGGISLPMPVGIAVGAAVVAVTATLISLFITMRRRRGDGTNPYGRRRNDGGR